MLFHHNCDLQHSNLILALASYRFREPEARRQPGPGLYADQLSVVRFRAVDVLHLMSSYASRSWTDAGIKLSFALTPFLAAIVSYAGLDKNASDDVKTKDLMSSALTGILCVSLDMLER